VRHRRDSSTIGGIKENQPGGARTTMWERPSDTYLIEVLELAEATGTVPLLPAISTSPGSMEFRIGEEPGDWHAAVAEIPTDQS
jgi:hypothetical protein